MRKVAAALGAALLLSPVRAFSASAEPELIEMERTPKSRAPARAFPAARPDPTADPSLDGMPRRGAPPARPDPAKQIKLDRDDIRDRIRLGKKRRPWILLRSRAWYARSTSSTRYAIQVPPAQVNPPAEVYLGETQETEATGMMFIHGAEFAPAQWISAELEYGESRRSGRWTNRYWVHAPGADRLTNLGNGATWNNPDHEDDEVFEADNSLRRDWLALNIHARVHEGRLTTGDEFELTHALDLTVGAHRWRQDGRMTNLRRSLSAGKLFAGGAIGPIGGFDSSYSSVWHGPHFGFREEMFVPLGFSFDGALLWSPFMEYRGDGYDNLTAGLRGESPNFTDRAHGSALHFRLGAAWTWSFTRVEAGFTRLSFLTRGGSRRYYYAGGATADQPLDLVDGEVSGLYVGASIRY